MYLSQDCTILSFHIPSLKNEDLCMKSDEIYETKFEISGKEMEWNKTWETMHILCALT